MTISEKIARAKQDYDDVYNAGYNKGQTEADGYDKGYADGVEQGKQAEYDRFWDEYQNYGRRTNYYQAFVQFGWNDSTLNPKYPITCKYSNSGSYVFQSCRATRIPVTVLIENVKAEGTFYYAQKLETISLLVLNGVTSFSNCFAGCSALKDLTIEGSIDVSINISATAVLSNASVQSIIDHLKDLTGQTAQTLTLHADVKGRMTEEQIASITDKNWTLA